MLRRCSGVTTRTLVGDLIRFTLAGLRGSDAAVNGGLGGAAPVVAGRGPASLLSAPLPRSVVFGVYRDILGLTTFSLLPTASLLCAFENVGYALGLTGCGESVEALRCISGTTEAILLLLFDECDTVLYVFSLLELSRSRSLFDEEEEVLLRVLDDRVLSLLRSLDRSRSRSRSLVLELLSRSDFLLRELSNENIMGGHNSAASSRWPLCRGGRVAGFGGASSA